MALAPFFFFFFIFFFHLLFHFNEKKKTKKNGMISKICLIKLANNSGLRGVVPLRLVLKYEVIHC